MKWWSKLIILTLLAAILAACVFFVIVIANGKISTDYKAYVSMAFSAASMSDGVAVVDDQGAHPLDPEACRKLNYFVSRNPVTTLRRGSDTVTLLVGEDTMTVSRLDDAGDSAVVKFTVLGNTYRMRVYAAGLWARVCEYTAPEHYVASAAAD